MIDCHCHISAGEFDHDQDHVLEEAENAGVRVVVAVAESFKDFESVIGLAERRSKGNLIVAPCLGVHPVQSGEDGSQRSACRADLELALPEIRKQNGTLIGIGEVGLDFQPRIAPTSVEKENQREVLRAQIELAEELHLPLNVHSRSAGKPTVDFLKECNAKNVVLHAFDGRPAIVRQGVEAGFFFSVPPSIVRSEQKQKLVSIVPLDQLLLETDSPALGPEKQVRNEPANLRISAEEVARIKGLTVDEVRATTTRNALRLFSRLAQILAK